MSCLLVNDDYLRWSIRAREFAICVLLVLGSGSLSGAETVRDPKLHISFVVPDGFVPVPEESRQPEFPHSFARDLDHPERTVFIRIRGSGGKRLTGNELSTDDVEYLRKKQPGSERFTEEWKSLRVDGIKASTTDNDGVRRVHYALPLSTEPEAVAILVSGPITQDAEIRQLLKAVLRSFEGTPSSPPSANGFVLKNKHLVLAGLALLVVVFLGWRLLRRKPVLPPTTPT